MLEPTRIIMQSTLNADIGTMSGIIMDMKFGVIRIVEGMGIHIRGWLRVGIVDITNHSNHKIYSQKDGHGTGTRNQHRIVSEGRRIHVLRTINIPIIVLFIRTQEPRALVLRPRHEPPAPHDTRQPVPEMYPLLLQLKKLAVHQEK